MRCQTVEDIMGQLRETGLPAELHMEPEGELPACALALADASSARLTLVAENALLGAAHRGAHGVLVIGHLPG